MNVEPSSRTLTTDDLTHELVLGWATSVDEDEAPDRLASHDELARHLERDDTADATASPVAARAIIMTGIGD